MSFLKPNLMKLLLVMGIIGIIVIGSSILGPKSVFGQTADTLFLLEVQDCACPIACPPHFNWYLIPFWIVLYLVSCAVFWLYPK